MIKEQFDEGEEIKYEARRHWFFVALQLVGLVFIAVVPLMLFLVLYSFVPAEELQFFVPTFLFWYSLWCLFVWFAIFMSWLDYYLDLWVITNTKLIEIEINGFFNREISTLRLDKIQDVTVSVNGLMATWLQFGTVEVQTAGSERVFIMRNMSNPYEVREKLLSTSSDYAHHIVK